MSKMYSYIPDGIHTTFDVCQQSRQKILSFPINNKNVSHVFDLIHLDIWGPFNTIYVHGFKYFMTILDDCSRHVWVAMLKSKSEVSQKIKDFIIIVETQLEKKVKVVRSDNGSKLLFPVYYASKGIIHQRNYAYTSQQNGREERRYQHILSISRTLMFESSLPKRYWSYAVLHAIFLMNMIPIKI